MKIKAKKSFTYKHVCYKSYTMLSSYSDQEISEETKRLYSKLKNCGMSESVCQMYSYITLEINRLKKKRNAVVLAHTYTTPDILYGVADYVGDSLKLSMEASKTKAEIIIFAGVVFMAETAKILNPAKRVFIVDRNAGCSLSDSITAEQVKELKRQYPGRKVITYVNTTAAVKAESDICCTSANAQDIVAYLPDKEFIFVPDAYMAKNIENATGKKLITWPGKCIVHVEFKPDTIIEWKKLYPDMKVLSHLECDSSVISLSDYAGGTEGIKRYIQSSDSKRFMIVTECGMSDRLRVEHPDKEFYGTCALCPYMKMNNLLGILEALKNLPKKNEILLDKDIIERARVPVQRMVELTEEIKKSKGQ